MTLSLPYILLDDAGRGNDRILAFLKPQSIISASEPQDVASALQALTNALESGKYAAGYFSYELGLLLEPKLRHHLPPKRNVPLLWFGIFDRYTEFDKNTLQQLANGRAYAGPLHYEWDEAVYVEKFSRAHGLIEAGDIYQTNISQRAHFSFIGDATALYLKLRTQSQSAYCAMIDDGERKILSLSPEKFFDIASTGVITTRPMKGTAARDEDPKRDAKARQALHESAKDRAENLMIVDLLRNDLGRIAKTSSVRVENLFEVESYPTVHQMVSTVRAQLKPSTAVKDVLQALFPCGSVTGAPKIRAMEIIDDIETSPRGIYCGAIGCFRPDGSATFNVAIRTLTLQDNRGELGIGSALVYDSKPLDEYQECLLKAKYYQAAREPLYLIETLRFAPGEGFIRLERHLARMQNSAAAFGISFDKEAAYQALRQQVRNASEALRVRLTLNEEDVFDCTSAPLGAAAREWRYALSPVAVHSGDELLQHKTSWRDVYETEQARLSRERGCDEVVFCNERGEITEGTRSNIFAHINGRLVTPPLHCGLLNGCLRQELLDKGEATEAVLMPDDLATAEVVYCGNSLRGLIQAVPVAQLAASAA